MELGRSAWIRRERLERIATAERDRRAGRTALAIAALGEASEWPARAVLALCLLPDSEGTHARRILEEGLDLWALESGLPSLVAVELRETLDREPAPAPPTDIFHAFESELDRPIEAGELERAFEEAEAQVDEMHDVNRVAESVLFDAPFAGAELMDEELDPLEESARDAIVRATPRPMDAASVPGPSFGAVAASIDAGDLEGASGRSSRAAVLATLEQWLQNLERARVERTQ
jgi:hypothetical protein